MGGSTLNFYGLHLSPPSLTLAIPKIIYNLSLLLSFQSQALKLSTVWFIEVLGAAGQVVYIKQ